MPTFDIVRTSTPSDSFRVNALLGKFDLSRDMVNETFTGSICPPDDWQIGVIYGRSGTGKSTVAGDVFGITPIGEYTGKSVIDDMPKGSSVDDISRAFGSVGFSSPPSWMKPYHVLSNGERMRVDIARMILGDVDQIIFDEFTSVVDRDVAKISSFAISKAIRRSTKQFVAVSCHDDILNWLEPDWVFCTNSMKMEGAKKKGQQSRSISSKEATEIGPIFASITI